MTRILLDAAVGAVGCSIGPKTVPVRLSLPKRRAFVAFVAAVLLLFAGAARATHSAARTHVVIWCDGIDDQTDEAASLGVENKKADVVSPVNVCKSFHVFDGSPTRRLARRVCEARGAMTAAPSLLFRPRLRATRGSARNDSPIPH